MSLAVGQYEIVDVIDGSLPSLALLRESSQQLDLKRDENLEPAIIAACFGVVRQPETLADWERTKKPHATLDVAGVDWILLDEFLTKWRSLRKSTYYYCAGLEDGVIGHSRFDSPQRNFVAECSSYEYELLSLLQPYFGRFVGDVIPEFVVVNVVNL